MSEPTALTVRPDGGHHMTLKEIHDQGQLIKRLLVEELKEGLHYGTLPGTPKPMLYKAGSEKILSLFRISIDPVVTDLSTDEEIRYRVQAVARHYPTGAELGSAFGEASSSEDKWKWRETICDEEYEATSPERRRIKFKKGRWDAKLRINGPATQTRQVRTEPADLANTVLKMASKRALAAVTLSVTAASDVFGQDLEDAPEELRGVLTDAPAMAAPERTDAPIAIATDDIKAGEPVNFKPKAQTAGPAPVTNPRQNGASAEVSSPKPAPASAGPAPVYLVTEAYVKTAGQSARGPWTLYGIKTKDGKEFTTFSDTIFETAQNAKELDVPCRITHQKTAKGNDQIVTFEPVEDPA